MPATCSGLTDPNPMSRLGARLVSVSAVAPAASADDESGRERTLAQASVLAQIISACAGTSALDHLHAYQTMTAVVAINTIERKA